MARKHGKLRAMPAVRHGNARIGGTRNGGSNARYNFKSNAGSIQGFRLLSPPAEHIRVCLLYTSCPAPLMTNGRPGYKWSWFISRVDYYYRCLQAGK